METIKKTMLQILTTGTTTGGTVIIPDMSVSYNLKIGLKQETDDIGFFDAYMLTGNTVGTTINDETVNVTGESKSRLSELRKYTVTTVFADQYINGGSFSVDGVDIINSTPPDNIIYYIGGIRYVDAVISTTPPITGTTFIFTAQGSASGNFINVPIYKDPKKENIISNPKINDDVFIIRQELSAFDKNYRLEYIKNLNDLTTYAAGNFFKIVNNT